MADAVEVLDRLTTWIATGQLLVSAYAWGDFNEDEFLSGFDDILSDEHEIPNRDDLPFYVLEVIETVVAELSAISQYAVQPHSDLSVARGSVNQRLKCLYEMVEQARIRLFDLYW